MILNMPGPAIKLIGVVTASILVIGAANHHRMVEISSIQEKSKQEDHKRWMEVKLIDHMRLIEIKQIDNASKSVFQRWFGF